MLVLNCYTIILALLLSTFVYFTSNKNLLNKLLALIFILPGLTFAVNTLQVIQWDIPNLQFYLLAGYVFAYLFAPTTYCYIKLLCGEKIRWKSPLFYTTIVLVLAVMILSFHSLLLADAEKKKLVEEFRDGVFPLEFIVLNTVFFITQLLYFTLSSIDVYRLKKTLKSTLNEVEKTRVRYADMFIKLVWVLNIILLVGYIFLSVEVVEYIASPILFMFFYLFVVYFGMKYNVIFHFDELNPFRKKTYIQYDDVEKKQFAELIIMHLEESKDYLNPEYSLTDLSKSINTFPTKVSQVINQELNKSFSDLINSYRIETAKKLLVEEKHLSVEGIALNSGFKSRATFYRVFKKDTGLTPLEFVNRAEEQ